MTTPNAKRESRFVWLDAVARLDAEKADQDDKVLLWALAYHANPSGECWPGESTLCRESGIRVERTLRRRLRRLEEKGFILTMRNVQPVQIGGRTLYGNRYRLTIPRADSIVSAHDGDGRTNPTPREDAGGMTGGQNEGGREDTTMSDKANGNTSKPIRRGKFL